MAMYGSEKHKRERDHYPTGPCSFSNPDLLFLLLVDSDTKSIIVCFSNCSGRLPNSDCHLFPHGAVTVFCPISLWHRVVENR